MNIARHQTNQRMSQLVVHNNTAYLSGQVAADAKADITDQTHSMLAKVDALLSSVSSDKNRILSATIYLANMNNFSAMNDVWDNWIPEGSAPARACVQAQMARPELLVEVSIIAAC